MSATNSSRSASLAAVFGCSGQTLEDDEHAFFSEANPFGFILFARNVDSPEQVRALITDLRSCVGRNAPVLIDQEGGRVQRLRPPHWRSAPPLQQFGMLFEKNPEHATKALRMNMQAIGMELSDLGIDVDCAPVLDVPVPGAHDVIGNRALSQNPAIVSQLAAAACEGLMDAGVVPVIKHLPGHGRAAVDSHEDLPVVEIGETDLDVNDFAPFKGVADLPVAGMTAHVVYMAFDADRPATLSGHVIADVIRDHIGFKGLLFSDDLAMKALTGTFAERAAQCLAAGCDVALHCNGNLKEMEEVAAGASKLTETAQRSVQILDQYRGSPRVDIDRPAVAFEVASLLENAA